MKDVNHRTPGLKDYHFVPKAWGYEKWLVNKPEYCGKILFLAKNRKLSLHYHKNKEETFYVSSGTVVLHNGIDEEDLLLEKGDIFHVPVREPHQLIAVEDSEIIEFSTFHEDSDSYRIEKGD